MVLEGCSRCRGNREILAVLELSNDASGVVDAERGGEKRARNINGTEGAADVEETVASVSVNEDPNDVPGVVNVPCAVVVSAGGGKSM